LTKVFPNVVSVIEDDLTPAEGGTVKEKRETGNTDL